jgi:hypothetical protein
MTRQIGCSTRHRTTPLAARRRVDNPLPINSTLYPLFTASNQTVFIGSKRRAIADGLLIDNIYLVVALINLCPVIGGLQAYSKYVAISALIARPQREARRAWVGGTVWINASD